MNTDHMFIITKSGLTIRPEGIELSFCLAAVESKLDTHAAQEPSS
jgi:hypothetical protein